MTSTIRIRAHELKTGDQEVFNGGKITRRVTSSYLELESFVVTYADGWVLHLGPDKVVTIQLPETHPIAVLERMRDRVDQQIDRASLAWIEAVNDALNGGDADAVGRRREDKALLVGKSWGLNQAIQELRAGIEAY